MLCVGGCSLWRLVVLCCLIWVVVRVSRNSKDKNPSFFESCACDPAVFLERGRVACLSSSNRRFERRPVSSALEIQNLSEEEVLNLCAWSYQIDITSVKEVTLISPYGKSYSPVMHGVPDVFTQVTILDRKVMITTHLDPKNWEFGHSLNKARFSVQGQGVFEVKEHHNPWRQLQTTTTTTPNEEDNPVESKDDLLTIDRKETLIFLVMTFVVVVSLFYAVMRCATKAEKRLAMERKKNVGTGSDASTIIPKTVDSHTMLSTRTSATQETETTNNSDQGEEYAAIEVV